MNWYKQSQDVLRRYDQIGHYEPWNAPQEQEKVVLWISDMSGGSFKMQEVDPTAGGHTDYWGVSPRVYKGRYDPFTNKVSVQMPFINRELTANDVPNRLVDRLMSEFPGASIYVSQASRQGETMVQII